MVKLKCGCEVSDSGEFIVSINCKFCKECNTISKLHPFSDGRFEGVKLK
jgi:hypothetical protein